MLNTEVFWRFAGSLSKESKMNVILSLLTGTRTLRGVNILMHKTQLRNSALILRVKSF